MEEMLTGGRLDVLTGDYLAELTMLILGRDRLKDPSRGYAKTFLRQLETGLGLAMDRGVRIVVNAGGLNPAGLADAVRELSERTGVPAAVAHVEGDDVLALGGGHGGWGEGVLTANAYLGGGGIAECLRAGADIVVTGRVTDAALVSGAAAAHFGWAGDDWDALAGAVTAGHVLECGAQATGGNYALFARENLDVTHPGFPLAEIARDGSAVITKHPGTGGAVTTGTVTAQLLYETAGARYAGPDVTARLDSVSLSQEGPDRVRIDGVRGEAPPPRLKVGLTRLGGWRNEVTFVLTGLDIEAKAALVRRQMEAGPAGPGREGGGRPPAEVTWTLARTDHADAPVQEEASAMLRMVVRDPSEEAVGRAVSGAAIELALASFPGFHVTAPPGKGSPYGVFEAAWIDADRVPHVAVLPDGLGSPSAEGSGKVDVPAPEKTQDLVPVEEPALPEPLSSDAYGPVRRMPLGELVGARSGDKGGSANVGVWVRGDLGEDAWRWLVHTLTVDEICHLLPEIRHLSVTRHVLPNLRAVNFVVDGLLGEGVASQARFDPQAKALGEWLRSRHTDIPEGLLP
ncbi:exopolyphosphatase [Streptomyces abyssalis]|uniref:Exopolyphosphatase n=1 Tax=Streptomyces abyssalis TaxID=933944 RepID=A0A1E7JQX2_9ACTN|nr:exopolyphosphatase [Streptomyces abyssalis]OEU90645.1 exopolyphosphatase [Streptomyces abyssalis]OEV04876.1 exopolyphosphatase [Streptomyces nanshensis]